MAKEKPVPSEQKEGKLKKEVLVYDGLNCQLKTSYPAGTPISKIQDGHKHLIKDTELE